MPYKRTIMEQVLTQQNARYASIYIGTHTYEINALFINAKKSTKFTCYDIYWCGRISNSLSSVLLSWNEQTKTKLAHTFSFHNNNKQTK